MFERLDFPRRARAAGLHLLISLAVAAVAAGLVFGVWFPGIYRQVAGGRDLFWLITSVDVVLGPLLTFAVFNIKKGWPHLRQDLAVIGAIQLAALAYGLFTVYGARPVAMVFETDRFRVIAAAQVEVAELPEARPEYRKLPLMGPWLLGARAAQPGDERNDALFKGLRGIDRAQRPKFWQPYADSTADALARARPLAMLLAQYPALAGEVKDTLQSLKVDEASARFLPLMGRGGDWVVILDSAGRLVHYVQAEGFF
ncbi:MAG: TfpX/TfpZ family type IV pilin accessory protein [Burkholderiales bacterium]|nr:TfpX/TfpZ family type IV pilin accessory protein [Burkholderiales bacterium]